MSKLEDTLDAVLKGYQTSFAAKEYNQENNEHDLLMAAFGISPDLKRQNRQYWGRELGMCWQLLVTELCELTCDNFVLLYVLRQMNHVTLPWGR